MDELVPLDDFRYKARMPSRAAAIRELLKRGLAAEGLQPSALNPKISALAAKTGRSQKPIGDARYRAVTLDR